MAELLPQAKGNEEQILALMAALGQHLVPQYLKNRDVPIPMTPEGLLAPNAAGKVPQLNPSALETGTMAGIDLATLLPGGLAKPMLAAGAGAAAKPGLSSLLKQLAAQSKKAAPGISEAEIEASLAKNPGASIFDVAGVKPGAIADAKAQAVTGMAAQDAAEEALKAIKEALSVTEWAKTEPPTGAARLPKDISISPLDWAAQSGTKHAADIMLGQSPEEIAALGFNPNLPLFKGGKSGQYKPMLDPASKDYEKAIFFADNPNIAEHYGKVLPFVARAEKAGEIHWPTATGQSLYTEDMMNAVVESARAQGYDLLKIKQLLDMGGKQDQYLVMQPNLVRAPHAKFDPAKLHLNDVLAGLGGAAVVPPLLKETDLLNGLRWNQ